MPWPSDQDYNEAIQNPATAFADEELRSSHVELNPMGLPKARSGNFATVYKVITPEAVHAVRCFRYDNPEHSIRYPAIASYLNRITLPYMVPFRFMSQGIRVGSNWYPVVKMKWVEGDSLVSYVEKNLQSHAALHDLAAAWARMIADLHHAKIAHGDLQHGNVLVVHGKLKLVDYDGMYVPALAGNRGLELGHRNYQHPQRTELDFGPNLDNFSAWLIYVSLIALSAQPTLWSQLKAGDECLLFRKEDLDAPDRSAVFRLLKVLPDHDICNLVDQIERFLWLPPNQIPVIADCDFKSKRTSGNLASSPPRPSWITDYTRQFVDHTVEGEFPSIEVGDQSWIQDHVDQKREVNSFANSVNVDRMIALVVFFATVVLCTWLSLTKGAGATITFWLAGTGAGSGITLACWRIRYRKERVFRTIRAIQSDLSRIKEEEEFVRHRLERLKTTRIERRDSYSEDCLQLKGCQDRLQSEEVKRLVEIEAVLQAALEQINDRKRSTTADEGAEKRRLAQSVGDKISQSSHVLSALPDQERQEMARLDSELGAKVRDLTLRLQQTTTRRDSDLRDALKKYQDQVVNGHLRQIRLSDAIIPGVGRQLKGRLAAAGYVSAGDIGARYSHVPGFGPKKVAALYAWRNLLEGPIRLREAPRSLPSYKSAIIEQRYEMQVGQLRQNLGREQTQLAVEQQKIKARFMESKRLLEAQKTAMERSLWEWTAAVEKKFNDHREVIAGDERSARMRFQQATDERRTRFRAKASVLAGKAEGLEKAYKTSLENLNIEIEDAAKEIRRVTWRRNQAMREYSAYVTLNFRRYLLRLLKSQG